jgi:stearoyl-CoA desaturase (delta-9 desaturase)
MSFLRRRGANAASSAAPPTSDAADRQPIGHYDRARRACPPAAGTAARPGRVSTVLAARNYGTAHQVTNLVALALPFLGFVLAVVLSWRRLVEPIDLILLAVGYAATCLGITVGFHRLLTHRSFKTYPAVRYILAVLGTLAVEGSVIKWVADHRKHHDFADEEGDPHSPHEAGLSALKGLWHAHAGWLFTTVGQADRRRYGADLLKDRGMRAIDAAERPLIAASLLLPFLLGLLIKGTLTGALVTLVWAGLVRIFLLHHATFSINSICHFFGRRRFETRDESTNVGWLSLATFGESWHNNHHAFPTSAFHGLRGSELDLGGQFIRGLERLGLAWDVVRVSPERQRQRGEAPAHDLGRQPPGGTRPISEAKRSTFVPRLK